MISAIRKAPPCVDIAQAGSGGKLEIAKTNKEKLDRSFDNIQNTNG